MFTKGAKVRTPHGKGVILGFEYFTASGKAAPISATDHGGRIIVKLEQPHAWKPTAMTPDPYYFRREVEVLPPDVVIKEHVNAGSI